MKKLFFIYHALPSKFQGGSELAAYNLIKIFSKKYKVTLKSEKMIMLKNNTTKKKIGGDWIGTHLNGSC